jgi:hypothetical protein
MSTGLQAADRPDEVYCSLRRVGTEKLQQRTFIAFALLAVGLSTSSRTFGEEQFDFRFAFGAFCG